MKKLKIIGLVFGLILIAAACNKGSNTAQTTPSVSDNANSNQATNPSPNPTPTEVPTPAPAPDQTPATVTVNITDSGFSPSTITVKAGTTVVFKNTGSNLHQPASDPHPTHTDLPGFDALHGLATGETYSFTFTKVGTWGYHDHFNPSALKGTVIVQ